MTAIPHAKAAVLLGALTLFTLAGCNRQSTDVPPASTTTAPTPAPDPVVVAPVQPPASVASAASPVAP